MNLQNRLEAKDYLTIDFETGIFKVPDSPPITCSIAFGNQDPEANSCTTRTSDGFLTYLELQFSKAQPSGSKLNVTVLELFNIFEKKPHSSVITVLAFTKEGGNNYKVAQGSLTVTNNDILVPALFN
jgi:hypothetical protein